MDGVNLSGNASSLYTGNVKIENGETVLALEIINIVILTLILIVALVGNGLVSFVQYNNKYKTSTDVFVTTLAAFGLFSGICSVPMMILRVRETVWVRVASDLYCGFYAYVLYVASTGTNILLTAIAVDRYLKTCWPHKNLITTQRAKIFCIAFSIVTIIFCTPAFVSRTYSNMHYYCQQRLTGAIFEYILTILFVVLFITNIVTYSLVARELRRKNKVRAAQSTVNISTSMSATGPRISTISTRKTTTTFHSTSFIDTNAARKSELNSVRQRKIVKIRQTEEKVRLVTFAMFLITLVFVLSWIVSWIALTIPDTNNGLVRLVKRMFGQTHIINCFANPIFYAWLNSESRAKAKAALIKAFTLFT